MRGGISRHLEREATGPSRLRASDGRCVRLASGEEPTESIQVYEFVYIHRGSDSVPRRCQWEGRGHLERRQPLQYPCRTRGRNGEPTAGVHWHLRFPRKKLSISTCGWGALSQFAMLYPNATSLISFDNQPDKRMVSVSEAQYDIPVARPLPSLPAIVRFYFSMTGGRLGGC